MKLSALETELFDSVEFCLALLGALPMPIFLVDKANQCTTISSFDSGSIKKISFISENENTNSWKIDPDNKDCIFAKALRMARKTNEKVSLKGTWAAENNHMVTEMVIAVHAVSAILKGELNVIVIVEDITQLEQLKGLLPICMTCNKIYSKGSQDWQKLEDFISQNSSANFSHGLCPGCSKEMINTLHRNEWGKKTNES
jgi:hypothetical protein